MKREDLKGKAMWPTTVELNDKVSQMCSDPRAGTLLVMGDVGYVPQHSETSKYVSGSERGK